MVDDLSDAIARLQERIARLEADLAPAEGRLAPLLEEKEALLQEVERLAAQRQAGQVPPELYESSLRALVDRLALLDEEIAASARVAIPERLSAVERSIADLDRGFAEAVAGLRALQDSLKQVEAVRGTPVDELRRAVDALGVELRENVRRLLQVDARALEQLKEVQGLIRGGRMEQMEAEIERIRALYQEFVSEDRLSQFTESIREILRTEEFRPIQLSIEKLEVALERQGDETQAQLGKLRDDAQSRFAEMRAQVEALQEEALRVQKERIESLQGWVRDLAARLGEQVKEVPVLRGQLERFQARVESLSSDLRALAERMRYRTTPELMKERADLEAELDLLRGAAERDPLARARLEAGEPRLRERLQEIQERLEARQRSEELARTLEEQREGGRRLLEELRKVPKPEEIRGLLDQMRRSMAAQELEELRGQMEMMRATLRNRIAEIPAVLEARLLEAPERQARALMKRLQSEADRLASSLGQALRKEVEARVEGEAARVSQAARAAFEEEIRRLAERTEGALREMSREMERLRAAQEAGSEEIRNLRREVGRAGERIDLLSRRTEKQSLETLLAMKERALRAVENIQTEAAAGRLRGGGLEEELRRAVAEVADIDARIEEHVRTGQLLARIQEQGERVAALGRSVEEVRALVAAGEAAGEAREKRVMERVRELLQQQETVLIAAHETRLRALRVEVQKQQEGLAGLEARLAATAEPAHPAASDPAEWEGRLREALQRVSGELEGVRDSVAALDLRMTRMEPALEARLRRLDEQQRRLEAIQSEMERIRGLVVAVPAGPKRRTLADLRAERERLLELLRGVPRGS